MLDDVTVPGAAWLAFDQPGIQQDLDVLGHGGLCQRQGFSDIGTAAFPLLLPSQDT